MAIPVAKRFPKAEVVGLDYWGKVWEYSRVKCERNARIEGVPPNCMRRPGFEFGPFHATFTLRFPSGPRKRSSE